MPAYAIENDAWERLDCPAREVPKEPGAALRLYGYWYGEGTPEPDGAACGTCYATNCPLDKEAPPCPPENCPAS